MSSQTACRTRPSRNCANCRAVKRRCDQQLPQCGQCVRMRQVCPGYRDEWELVFRDQTSHTIKRSKKKYEKKAVSTPSPPTGGLDPDLDEIGVNYFLFDFVSGGRSPRGYLNYIPTAYRADAEHPTLVTSMAAVGLVALATQRPELVGPARAKYSQAIRQVSSALASPEEALRDSTLMSIISLGVFEHVSNFESWVRHVKGAAALVVARGKSQFTSPAAILMFNQVRADMTAACIQTIQPFPDDLMELQAEATRQTDPTSAFWLAGELASRCATLLANVTKNNMLFRNNGGVQAPGFMSWYLFLEEALALWDGFEQIFALYAIQEPYTTAFNDRKASSAFHKGRCDLYRTSLAIRLWNNSRMTEIIVGEIACWLINKILTTDSAKPSQVHPKLAAKRDELLRVIFKRGEDVLASVPQGLGHIALPGSQTTGLSPTCVSGGYMLTWNLFTVARSPAVDDETRNWVTKQLEGIGKSAGIGMALQLAREIVKVKI